MSKGGRNRLTHLFKAEFEERGYILPRQLKKEVIYVSFSSVFFMYKLSIWQN